MKTYGEIEAYIHSSLTSVADGWELSVSRSNRFAPGEIIPQYLSERRVRGPTAGLDVVKK
jgi:hypothetical protein